MAQAPVWWPQVAPSTTPTASPNAVVVATVNYNTKFLIAHLIWSLYQFLGDELQSVVVVDNGSTDGSVELLQAVADAGLCELLVNRQNQHHGPALSQAISHVAQAHREQQKPHPWLWLLDSDCVIARHDAAQTAIAAAVAANATLVGEAYWNQWHKMDRFAGYSLLFDPAIVWQPAVGKIPDDGDPIGEFEAACRAQAIAALSFPFAQDGYLIHIGRSTLAAVHERTETENPLYEWAKDHHEPHFQQIPTAQMRYAALVDAFKQQVPELAVERLIEACRH